MVSAGAALYLPTLLATNEKSESQIDARWKMVMADKENNSKRKAERIAEELAKRKAREAMQEFVGSSDHIAQGFLNCSYVYDAGGKGLEGGAYTLRSWRDDFYHWQDGCWNRLTDAALKRKVVEHIQYLNGVMMDGEQDIPVTTQRVNNILLSLKGRIGVSESIELNSWEDGREALLYTIPVNNGLVCLDYKNFRPDLTKHTPHYFGLTKLPYDFDPDATCPEWEEFLDDVMRGRTEYIRLLQQWCGYLFRPDLREHKFLLCVGEGANGKTVFFDVVESVIGSENCSHVGLSQLHRPFTTYAMLGKMANITNESSHLIEDEGENVLKTLVSGDSTYFERKHQEPVSVKPTAKFMIATNAKPRFNDKTQGTWRRILLIPFNREIAEPCQIKDYAKRLTRERSGILNWALKGLRILNQNDGFIMPTNAKELLEEYRRDADPARAFLLENYIEKPDGMGVGCSELYNAYKQYCQDNSCRPMNNRTFGRHVSRIFPDSNRTRQRKGADREYVYEGLGQKEVCTL